MCSVLRRCPRWQVGGWSGQRSTGSSDWTILIQMIPQNAESRAQVQPQAKRSILFANSNLTYIQLGELQKHIAELLQQNRKKYTKISAHRPDFSYQLYKTGEFQANSRPFGKELLLRQMDRLLEEKNYLDRELSLIRFESEEQTDQKQKMMTDEANHFELLKSIWKKDRQSKYEGAVEHVEELNLMVAQIKTNIHSLIKFEANEHKDFEQTYLATFQVLHDRNKECRKCGEYKAKNDALALKLEAIEQKLSKLSDENISFLEEISKRDEKLKKVAKSQLKQETELKDKLIRLEQELLKREQNIKQLKKEIAQSESNRLVNQKEGFSVIFKGTDIDFTKIQTQLNIPAQRLIALLTEQHSKDLKTTSHDANRYSTMSKCDSTEDSAKSNHEVTYQSGHSIVVSKVAQNISLLPQKLGTEGLQKRRALQTGEHKLKLQELQAGCKRYVRTSSKKNNRSASNLFNDDSQGGISSRARGVSPRYHVNLQ